MEKTGKGGVTRENINRYGVADPSDLNF